MTGSTLAAKRRALGGPNFYLGLCVMPNISVRIAQHRSQAEADCYGFKEGLLEVAQMTTYQAFLLGAMVAYTPSLILLALLVCRSDPLGHFLGKGPIHEEIR